MRFKSLFEVHLTSFFLVVMFCTSCGGPTDTESADTASVGTERQAISPGYTLSDANYSGIVSLLRFSPTLGVWYTFCTGTLMRNSKVLTARHCFTVPDPDIPDNELIKAKMGTQTRDVAIRTLHSSCDVAVLTLFGGMEMWNWRYDHFMTSPAKKTFTDYARSIYSGTDQSLNGSSTICWGYGGATASVPQPSLTYAGFSARYPTPVSMCGHYLVGLTGTNPSGATFISGDSGGPCLMGLSPYTSIISSVISTGGYYVFAAETWRTWATTQIGSP